MRGDKHELGPRTPADQARAESATGGPQKGRGEEDGTGLHYEPLGGVCDLRGDYGTPDVGGGGVRPVKFIVLEHTPGGGCWLRSEKSTREEAEREADRLKLSARFVGLSYMYSVRAVGRRAS